MRRASRFIRRFRHGAASRSKGARILVWDEQGLGDLLQFARYLPLLAERGAEVTLFGRRSTFRLLGTLAHPPHFIEQRRRRKHL